MSHPTKTRLVMITALGAALIGASLLGACGKLGELETAPPVLNSKAEASWSASKNPDGGITLTTDSSASRETERALPDSDAKNSMAKPYTGNKKMQDAPLEGMGNNTGFNNPPVK